MAKNFIPVTRNDTAAIFSSETLAFKAALQTVMERGNALLGKMNCNVAAGDFVDIEARFGIPTGQGATVYAWVRDIMGDMNGTESAPGRAKILVDRLG